ncbi:MAG TPA: Lrp/AsnC family transcriptional regulator [Clostridia bacterium]|nr:Lrp/AsnC family transcriptional regulator [Clostridia bacterium]
MDTILKTDTIDEIDKEIIKLLCKNARMSYVEIGEMINLSRVAVKNRIKALEDKGIIQGYSAIVNTEKLGRSISVFFYLVITPRNMYEVAEELATKDYVTEIYQMTGSSHLHVQAVFPSNEHLQNFLRDELYCMEGIKEFDWDLIVTRTKTRKIFLI